MKLIGLSGKIGTGKSTLARLLVRKLSPEIWVHTAFGDTLKSEISEVFSVPLDVFYTDKGRFLTLSKIFHVDGRDYELRCGRSIPDGKVKITARELLQWYGTEFRRSQNPNYWNEATERKLKKIRADGVIIDDIRFRDELQFVKDRKGLAVRLEPFLGWFSEKGFAEHRSETELDDCKDFDILTAPDFGGLPYVAELIGDKIKEGVL